MTNLNKHIPQKKPFRVTLIGLPHVGKTTLCNKIKSGHFGVINNNPDSITVPYQKYSIKVSVFIMIDLSIFINIFKIKFNLLQ